MSPRTDVQNREVRAITRTKLLNSALELFALRGYAATSVDAIAEAAGVSAGLLYHHFDGKAAVLNAIFEQSLTDVQATFAAADREVDAADRLPALLRSAAAIVPRHRNFWAVWYGLRMQREVLKSLGPSVGEFTVAIVRTLERYLSDIGWPNAAIEARLLFAQIDGLCQHYVLDPEH
jgi:AcrR family transcriptional regulator